MPENAILKEAQLPVDAKRAAAATAQGAAWLALFGLGGVMLVLLALSKRRR